jgi:IS30 family transposase
MCHYHHLSTEEREELLRYLSLGYSQNRIAKELKRSPSTISRELSRNDADKANYSPSKAEKRYKSKRQNSVRKKRLETSPEMRNKVHFLLCYLYWSPEQISNRLDKEGMRDRVSTSTIYRAFHNGALRLTMLHYLRIKSKRIGKAKKPKRSFITKTIHERPKEANERVRIGDWECDTVLGYCENRCVFTYVDRKSRFFMAAVSPSKEAAQFKDVTLTQFECIPKEYRKTITTDRGTEFALMSDVESNLALTAYFADPHSPWQKGTVENTNGLLRQFLPKRTSFDSLTQESLDSMVAKINMRPRKILGWKTPYEIFTGNVLHFT